MLCRTVQGGAASLCFRLISSAVRCGIATGTNSASRSQGTRLQLISVFRSLSAPGPNDTRLPRAKFPVISKPKHLMCLCPSAPAPSKSTNRCRRAQAPKAGVSCYRTAPDTDALRLDQIGDPQLFFRSAYWHNGSKERPQFRRSERRHRGCHLKGSRRSYKKPCRNSPAGAPSRFRPEARAPLPMLTNELRPSFQTASGEAISHNPRVSRAHANHDSCCQLTSSGPKTPNAATKDDRWDEIQVTLQRLSQGSKTKALKI
jgi:hypothetical protein